MRRKSRFQRFLQGFTTTNLDLTVVQSLLSLRDEMENECKLVLLVVALSAPQVGEVVCVSRGTESLLL